MTDRRECPRFFFFSGVSAGIGVAAEEEWSHRERSSRGIIGTFTETRNFGLTIWKSNFIAIRRLPGREPRAGGRKKVGIKSAVSAGESGDVKWLETPESRGGKRARGKTEEEGTQF